MLTSDLNAIRVFIQVAQARSFAAAAQVLDMTPSGVSKAVSRLEKDLGVRLLHRTTRAVSMTNDGQSFLERCQNALLEIADAENVLGQARVQPQGRLRVKLPVGFGRKVVAPALPAFVQRYPGVTLDVELSDRIADVVHEGLDLAITIGLPDVPGLIARRLCTQNMVICASPSYVERHGLPAVPDDLDRHQCLGYPLPQTRRYRDWLFSKNGRTQAKTPSGALNVNHAESLLAYAEGGAGVVMISTFMAADALRSGALVQVLAEYRTRGPDVYAVFPPSRNLSVRVRAFVDLLDDLVKQSAHLQSG